MIKLKGTVGFSLVTTTSDKYPSGQYVHMTLRDDDSMQQVIEIEMPLDMFAQALFTVRTKCEFEFNDSGRVGKKAIHKTVRVPVLENEPYAGSKKEKEQWLLPIMEPFVEADGGGWTYSVDSYFNPHNRGNGGATVILTKWVDRES